jgi:hypothetical protein
MKRPFRSAPQHFFINLLRWSHWAQFDALDRAQQLAKACLERTPYLASADGNLMSITKT